MSITDLAWTLLEEARAAPLLAERCNPGTVYALRNRGLIACLPPWGGTIAITDAGLALLKRREKEIADALINGTGLAMETLER